LNNLTNIRSLVVDMDGVLYRGNMPLPGLKEFFAFLRRHDIRFVLATNNSTRTPQAYADKLAGMGVEVATEEVLTSGQVVAQVMAKKYPPGTRVHVFGMPSLRQAVAEAGFELADEGVAAVAASMDWELSYEKLKQASLLIRGGAEFYATNLDPTFPAEDGLLPPGTGSVIAFLRTASEATPIVTGKPEAHMFTIAMERMGAAPEISATIGDRLDTDLEGGRRSGMTTICVLSGSTGREAAEAFHPDFIFEDIGHLVRAWQEG
jgi:4-nitrophenyl phosphatase